MQMSLAISQQVSLAISQQVSLATSRDPWSNQHTSIAARGQTHLTPPPNGMSCPGLAPEGVNIRSGLNTDGAISPGGSSRVAAAEWKRLMSRFRPGRGVTLCCNGVIIMEQHLMQQEPLDEAGAHRPADLPRQAFTHNKRAKNASLQQGGCPSD
eukprot:GHUV01045420.1.p1 GENE.GHUV01045420.1~~GHUV01045420.1.p1  ORF type:complete len:154 (+),score=44.36 GHUV01045420.1:414-875(+)